jgi:hypothetical protein
MSTRYPSPTDFAAGLVPARGSMADHPVRDRDHAGSSPAAQTNTTTKITWRNRAI